MNPETLQKLKKYSAIFMGISYFLAGLNHFPNVDFYMKIMPPSLPWHLELVYLSGAIEMILGVMMFFPRWQKPAAWGILLLLIAVFPANIYLAQTNGAVLDISPAMAWGRLPIQGVFGIWAWWHTR